MLCLVTSKRCERNCPEQERCGIRSLAVGFAEGVRDPIPLDVVDFLRRLLDPEDLGHAVSDEVRTIARRLLA